MKLRRAESLRGRTTLVHLDDDDTEGAETVAGGLDLSDPRVRPMGESDPFAPHVESPARSTAHHYPAEAFQGAANPISAYVDGEVRAVNRARFTALAQFGAVSAGIVGVYAAWGIGIECPFLATTGLQCPLCGSTRMGVALLTGNPVSAWFYNPMMFLVGIALLFAVLIWVVEVITDRWVVGPQHVARLRRGLLIGLPVVAAGWTILRNLPL